MSSGTVIGALLVLFAALVAIGLVLAWQRIVQPRQRRAAEALYAEVELQLLTQAAMAVLLDEARQALLNTSPPR